MSVTGLHICLEMPEAPGRDAEYPIGARWVCECGTNFVYREGFNRGGQLTAAWWEAPAVPRPRRAVRDLLFGPRRG